MRQDRDGVTQVLETDVRPPRREEAALEVERALDQIVGESVPIREIKRRLRKIAESPTTTVLLVGESGTGKGLVAKVLHQVSARSFRPFETICCSALPEALLESELFGHDAGAFTDARRQKRGLIELANGGTVFLDEIGETSLPLQVKLLHFLEERRFKRLGGIADVEVDVRVIAATNRDLEHAVRQGLFRADLYYRLNVLPIRIPPLRHRPEDIPPLIRHFVDLFNRQFGRQVHSVPDESLARLEAYGWPGNIRQLRNRVERAMLLGSRDALSTGDLEPTAAEGSPCSSFELPPEGIDLGRVEEDLLRQALARTRGNQSGAAQLLGLSRHQLRYRMEKFRLTARPGPPPPRDRS